MTLRATIFLLLTGTLTANAGPVPDSTFQEDGRHLYAWLPDLADLAIGRDHAWVITNAYGDPRIARLRPDGTPDNAFSGDGIAGPETLSHAEYTNVPLQSGVATPDGGLLVAAGPTYPGGTGNAIVAKLSADGGRQTGWGSNGYTLLPLEGYALLEQIHQDRQGRLIAAANFEQTHCTTTTARLRKSGTRPRMLGPEDPICSMEADAVIARLTSQGGMDLTFGINGIRTIEGIKLPRIVGLVGQPDGRITALVQERQMDSSSSVPVKSVIESWLVRFLPGGTLDTGFSSDGKLALSGKLDQIPTFLVARAGGGYLVGSWDTTDQTTQLLSLTDAGATDSGYGSGGAITVNGYADPGTIAAAPNGGLVVLSMSGGAAQIRRYSPTGIQVNEFGVLSVDHNRPLSICRLRLWGVSGLLSACQTADTNAQYGAFLASFEGATDTQVQQLDFQSPVRSTAGQLVTSAPVVLRGAPTGYTPYLAVTGGEYRVGGGAWTRQSSAVTVGNQLALRHTAGTEPGDTVTTQVTIGGYHNHHNHAVELGERVTSTFTSQVNTPPSVPGGALQVAAGQTLRIEPLARDDDGDSLQYTVLEAPAQGTLRVLASQNAAEYTAGSGATGEDAFTLRVSDGLAEREGTWTVDLNGEPTDTGGTDTDTGTDAGTDSGPESGQIPDFRSAEPTTSGGGGAGILALLGLGLLSAGRWRKPLLTALVLTAAVLPATAQAIQFPYDYLELNIRQRQPLPEPDQEQERLEYRLRWTSPLRRGWTLTGEIASSPLNYASELQVDGYSRVYSVDASRLYFALAVGRVFAIGRDTDAYLRFGYGYLRGDFASSLRITDPSGGVVQDQQTVIATDKGGLVAMMGIRSRFTMQTELFAEALSQEAAITPLQTDDQRQSLTLGGRYWLDRRTSIGLGYSILDGEDAVNLQVRLSY